MADSKLLPLIRVWQGIWLLMIVALLFVAAMRLADGIATGDRIEVLRAVSIAFSGTIVPLAFLGYATWLARKVGQPKG